MQCLCWLLASKDDLHVVRAAASACTVAPCLQFFDAYDKLLRSSNYVTRRQSIKLLGDLVLDRGNVKIMMRYVGDVKHLMMMMNLLRDSSKSIQFEAFHVFKVRRATRVACCERLSMWHVHVPVSLLADHAGSLHVETRRVFVVRVRTRLRRYLSSTQASLRPSLTSWATTGKSC